MVSTKVGNKLANVDVSSEAEKPSWYPVSSPSKSISKHETLETMIYAYMMKKFGTLMHHLAHYEFESVF